MTASDFGLSPETPRLPRVPLSSSCCSGATGPGQLLPLPGQVRVALGSVSFQIPRGSGTALLASGSPGAPQGPGARYRFPCPFRGRAVPGTEP